MYSTECRRIAVRLYAVLHSLRRTAIIMQVGHSSIARWIARPLRQRYKTRSAPKTEVVARCVRHAVERDPFLSVHNIRRVIFEATHVSVSSCLVCSVIKALGLSKKKARFHARPVRVQGDTVAFLRVRKELMHRNVPFVSVDETSFS